MVKLDASVLKYLSKDDFRVLTAIEMGMKNHDLVPSVLIASLSNLKFDESLLLGGCHKALVNLHKHKLIYHQSKPYDGYRLTYAGYDYLVLKTLSKRGSVSGIGRQIGIGKESDIYVVINEAQEEMAFKFHRLGRTSFRSIKRNRDYHQHRKSASWLYLSRLAALKEFSYMTALHQAGFPVPTPIDLNRHGICMELIHAHKLADVNSIRHPDKVYTELMNLLVKLAQHGVIHGDFNEFNIMIDDKESITLIDFPQMVSVDHPNAEFYFDRDVQCIRALFERRYGFIPEWWPKLHADTKRTHNLDKEVAASGFTRELQSTFEQLLEAQSEAQSEAQQPAVGDDSVNEESDSDVGDEIAELNAAELVEEHILVTVDVEDDLSSEGGATRPPLESRENSQLRLEENLNKNFATLLTPSDTGDNSALSNRSAPEIGLKAKPGLEQPSKDEVNDSSHADEIARRQHIQKRVKQKLQQAERRKKGNKNISKNRDKRALNVEVKTQGEFW